MTRSPLYMDNIREVKDGLYTYNEEPVLSEPVTVFFSVKEQTDEHGNWVPEVFFNVPRHIDDMYIPYVKSIEIALLIRKAFYDGCTVGASHGFDTGKESVLNTLRAMRDEFDELLDTSED